MRHRSPARFLAPVALLASALVVIVVVGAAGKHGSTPARPGPAAAAHGHLHRAYRVHHGDTLSKVALRTGISLDRLKQLNPRIDPNALRPGQRLKLR